MTEWRDARFRQALDAAPDADARPAPAVAQAIRAAARHALPPVPAKAAPLGWWQRLWQATAQPRAPWNAAFATLLVAVLVTVLWVREPIPDARPVALPTPAREQPPTTTDAVAPGGAEAVPALAPRVQPAPKAPVLPQPAAAPETGQPDSTPPPLPQPPAVAPPAPLAPNQAAANPATAPAAPLQDKARALEDLQLRADDGLRGVHRPPQVLADRVDSADRAERSSRAAATPAAAPLLQAAPPAVEAMVSAKIAAPATAGSTGLEGWNRLTLQIGAQSATLDRTQARMLFTQLQALALHLVKMPAGAAEAPAQEPGLRLSLLAQSDVLAVLRLWGNLVQWQRPGQADVWARIAAGEAQTLQLLSEQALGDTAATPR
jgi:Meckel syndrome type 1 protein